MAKEDNPLAKYFAEFLGTYLLVFTVGCNVLSGNAVWGVTSIACVLMVLVYAMADVSGSNFNPAVSLALGVSGKLDWKEVGIYIIAQFVGGILGALSYTALFWQPFNLAPSRGFGWAEAGAAEIFYTFLLCFVVLNCAVAQPGKQFYGLAIGFSIVAGGYSAGAISGGCFNPAVALGIDLSSAGLGFGWAFAYIGFEMIGAALAAFLYRVVRPEEFQSSPSLIAGVPVPSIVAEFLGTFILVLTVGLSVLTGFPVVWAIAASLMVMIFSLGDVSGAHFNPAVTVAVMASGRWGQTKMGVMKAAIYIVAQILGGIVAAFTFSAMYGFKTFAYRPTTEDGENEAYSIFAQCVAEITFTFVLCFVVLSVATTKKPLSEYFGFAIGSCVTVGGYAIGSVSGGVLNPAVAISLSTVRLIDTTSGFWHCIVYSLAELVGAALAAGLFFVTHPSEYPKSQAAQPA